MDNFHLYPVEQNENGSDCRQASDTQCIARHFVLLDKDESCLTADLSNIGRPNGPAYSTDELLNTPQLVMYCFWWPVLVATLRSMFVRYPLLAVSTVLGTPRVGLWICGSVRPSHKMSLLQIKTSIVTLHFYLKGQKPRSSTQNRENAEIVFFGRNSATDGLIYFN